jgi:DNA polymerase-1
MLISNGISFRAHIEDVQAMAHLLNAEPPLKLNNLGERYLGADLSPIDELRGWLKWKKREYLDQFGRPPNYSDIPWNILKPYASLHSILTIKLFFLMKEPVREQFQELYEMERDSIPANIAMKMRGVPIDRRYCREQKRHFLRENRKIARRWDPVLLSSPKQIAEIVFPRFHVKVTERTKKGQPRTGGDVIKNLSVDHPELEDIVTYRSNGKLANTYFENLLESSICGFIYPSFNPYGAKTGRFSSSDPNLQNQPRGPVVRTAFICRPGYINLYYDFKQVELRRMAEYANDRPFIDIFLSGRDPHYETAVLFYGEKLAVKRRHPAKVGNFQIIYGTRPRGLAREAEIPIEEATSHIRMFFREHPAIRNFRADTIKEARNTGRVMDMWGRLHTIRKEEDVRAAPNWIIQGDCATILKRALIRSHRFIEENNLQAHVLMVVHDEIPIEVPLDPSLIEDLVPVLQEEIQEPREFQIPLPVDIDWSATNWATKVKWDPKSFRETLRRIRDEEGKKRQAHRHHR